MRHLVEKIQSYASHYHMEQQGYRNRADAIFSTLHADIAAHSQAVGRASVVAYREGLAGVQASPAYTPWEQEAWESGVADRK